MKFQITAEHRFRWPVTVSLPDPDKPGRHLKQQFTGTFEAIPIDEAKKLFEETGAITDQAEAADAEIALVEKVLVGWDEAVVGDDGKPIPFSTETLAQANRWGWFRRGAIEAYQAALAKDPAKGN